MNRLLFFNAVLEAINMDDVGIFCLDAPGGTGIFSILFLISFKSFDRVMEEAFLIEFGEQLHCLLCSIIEFCMPSKSIKFGTAINKNWQKIGKGNMVN